MRVGNIFPTLRGRSWELGAEIWELGAAAGSWHQGRLGETWIFRISRSGRRLGSDDQGRLNTSSTVGAACKCQMPIIQAIAEHLRNTRKGQQPICVHAVARIVRGVGKHGGASMRTASLTVSHPSPATHQYPLTPSQ